MGGAPLNVISLGAGVQSSTMALMALMAAHGEITPMPDCAIFADTGWEPRAVYDWLSWLTKQLPFPVHHVQSGNLRRDIEQHRNSTGQRFAAVPWFMVNPDGTDGMGRRQCTAEYKLKPVRRKLRELVGLMPGQRCREIRVQQWIGISSDEITRMKMSRDRWCENRFPLVDLRMSRWDCLRWMEKNGYPTPPRSSCLGCPFHSDAEWRHQRDTSPDEWADTLRVDEMIRHQPKIRSAQYMHRSNKPLSHVDLSTAEDRGQLNMFNNECEGMCGV